VCAPTAGPTRYRSSSPTKAELASLAASSSRQARSPCFAGSGAFGATLLAAILLSAGTALVHPTLIAAVSDAVQPVNRAPAAGVYRFWRDFGNARLAGATPLWEWIGDEPATVFSY